MIAARATAVALLAAAAGCQTMKDLKQTAYDTSRSLLTSSYDDPQAEEKVRVGEQYYEANDFGTARKMFADVASNTYNPILLAEKARYMEAECYRQERQYPAAVDTYHRMLIDFPGGAYRERACGEIFKIADYWLDDTRADLTAEREGKSTWGPRMARLVRFDATKPTLDQEGRALQALEHVHTNDITGPAADKALFWAGYVNFHRGNFVEADHYFSLLVEMHKDSDLRPAAVELAVISKNNSTGGSVYDGQKAAEALQLVHHAEATMPEFRTEEKSAFMTRQKMAIRMQQAEKDFKTAEYYERTANPGSAYFNYELVRRRYPGTKYSDLATARMEKLRESVERGDKPGDFIDRMRDKLAGAMGRKTETPRAAAPK